MRILDQKVFQETVACELKLEKKVIKQIWGLGAMSLILDLLNGRPADQDRGCVKSSWKYGYRSQERD